MMTFFLSDIQRNYGFDTVVETCQKVEKWKSSQTRNFKENENILKHK
jgi:hypothetical protein